MSTTLLPDPLLDSRLEKKTLLRSIFGISNAWRGIRNGLDS